MNRLVLVLSFCSLFWISAKSDVSLIMNGSFEKNGYEIPDITDEAPVFWCDVNVPVDKFEGRVDSGWSSFPGDGSGYSIELRTPELADLQDGDRCYVSQKVFIGPDVNSLSFDLYLSTNPSFTDWDVNERTAMVLIDDTVLWDSDALEYDEDGEFLGTVEIDSNSLDPFLDGTEHTLTLALQSDVTDDFATVVYMASWDFIKFDKYCGGFGYLPGDLNQDCYVDLADFAELAGQWMNEPEAAKYDLFDDGVTDVKDLELFAEDWLYNTNWQNWGGPRTFRMELLEADFDLSGAVDAGDLMILSEYWLGDGTCAGIEMSGDEIINFEDFAVFTGYWQLRDWLYYVD